MSTVSISSRPSEAPTRPGSFDVVLFRSVATTCQPRLRYSSAKANPRPREAPMSRSFLLDESGGIRKSSYRPSMAPAGLGNNRMVYAKSRGGKNKAHAINETTATLAYGVSHKRGLALARDFGFVFGPGGGHVAVARVSDTRNTANCRRS